MRECSFCGESARPEDRFCGKCGAELLEHRVADARRETVPLMNAAEVHRKLASVYHRQGNHQRALAALTKSLELEPEHEETLTLVAQVKSDMQRA